MPKWSLTPAQFLAASFGGLITVGSLALLLPLAVEPGQSLGVIDAIFTATSAICVTGLTVVDTPRVLSSFGEVTLAVLIQAGGLGYMTISTVLAAAVGRKLSMQQRVVLRESLNVDSREGLVRFAERAARVTVLVESLGALALTLHWWPRFGFGQAAYFAAFHSVSAFNNAGFSLFSENLTAFRDDPIVNLVITTLIIAGGLGFIVLNEVGLWLRGSKRMRSFAKMSTHTRLVLLLTAILLTLSTLAVFLLERENPRTLGEMGWAPALMASYFQAVTARTAGFHTIEIGAMLPVSLFVLLVLMFIGASPGGTGGGVKTTTFGVTVAALWATVRGEREPVLLKRRLGPDTVGRAFFVSLIAFLALNAGAVLLLMAEHRDLLPTLFETTSAFGTVGLSMGEPGSVVSLAGHMSVPGKVILMTMMFVGRVGPLTLAVAVVGRHRTPRFRYPEARVMIG